VVCTIVTYSECAIKQCDRSDILMYEDLLYDVDDVLMVPCTYDEMIL